VRDKNVRIPATYKYHFNATLPCGVIVSAITLRLAVVRSYLRDQLSVVVGMRQVDLLLPEVDEVVAYCVDIGAGRVGVAVDNRPDVDTDHNKVDVQLSQQLQTQ